MLWSSMLCDDSKQVWGERLFVAEPRSKERKNVVDPKLAQKRKKERRKKKKENKEKKNREK